MMNSTCSDATIRDVAREAGVGLGTVSRVLNGGNHVKLETRERVLWAIRRLRFRPHAQARRIQRKRTEVVCFLLSNRKFPNSFHARILQGVEDCARELRQHVLFAGVHYDSTTPPWQINLPSVLDERGWFDGLILSGTNHPNFLTRIQKLEAPFVVFGNNLVDFEGEKYFDQVGFDGFKGELEAIESVLGLGHRDCMFVGDISYPWVRVRYEAFLKSCRDHRLEPRSITTARELSFVDYGEWAGERVMDQFRRPTAVLAVNDEVAFGLWRSFRRRGIRVPSDISLMGFDDREEALLMDPPLTTVRVQKEEIGQTCLRTLLERLRHPEMAFVERTLPTEVVVRGTVRKL